VVVDNSVMMRWLFQDGSDTDQDYARGVLNAVGKNELQIIVPYIWVYESAFVVDYYSRGETKSYDEYMECLSWLFDVSTVIRGEVTPASLYEFSQTHSLSAYDAAYVMLALDQSCPIATLDKSIIKISKKVKSKIFKG